MNLDFLLIGGISFFAFFLKGLTGTGTSTVVVSLCSLIIDPKSAVVLASFVNIFGGFSMLGVDPIHLHVKY